MVWQLSATLAVTVALFALDYPGEVGESLRGFLRTGSALAAGLASAIPAGLYAWRASVERSATRFLLQGVVKFALTLVLVAVCIIVLKPAAAAFFGTLILMQMLYVVVPLATGNGSRGE